MVNGNRTESRARILISLIVIVVLLGIILDFNIDKAIDFILPLGISFILSGVAGDFLESLTGDFFKKVYLSFDVQGFRVNLPLFFVLSIIIKIWLFS